MEHSEHSSDFAFPLQAQSNFHKKSTEIESSNPFKVCSRNDGIIKYETCIEYENMNITSKDFEKIGVKSIDPSQIDLTGKEMFSLKEKINSSISNSNTIEKTPELNEHPISHNNNENLKTRKAGNIDNFAKDAEQNFETINKTKVQSTSQFCTASGQGINICSSPISKIKSTFEDFPNDDIGGSSVFQSNTLDNKKYHSNSEVQTSKISKKETATPGFSTASGKKIKISSNKLSKIHNVFKDITDLKISDFIANIPETVNHEETGKLDGNNCNTPSLRTNNTSKNCGNFPIEDLKYQKQIFSSNQVENGNYDKNSLQLTESSTKDIASLFSTASGKTIKLPSASLQRINNIFNDIPDFNDLKTDCPIDHFSTPSSIKISSITPTISETKDTSSTEVDKSTKPSLKESFKRNYEEKDKTPLNKEKIESETNSKINENKVDLNNITPQRSIPRKRRLGAASSNGKISEAALSKAKSLFGDINFDDLKLPSHLKIESPNSSNTLYTPIKPIKINTPRFSSTPIRLVQKNESILNDTPQEINHPYLIQKPTPGRLEDFEEELNRQQKILEKKLEFVMRKREAIKMQIHAQTANKRFKLDYQEKKNKINLKDVKNLEMQSDSKENPNRIILQVNPQNAALIHFNNNWYEVPTVKTEDGCTLVPNAQGFIGISEIEPAFISMTGIQKDLIPDGWIKNHYRWIIWKLASYERFFPVTLGGCFSIDNVIRQLKYRYLKEIYNAERPALRRIYEKDDVPQKRMILCISNIIKNGDNTELELTDGWYSIRTIVDDPLCCQIKKQKIKIGSKLIISGAELLNCEGCHPLEIEQARKVRLKIFFNSTRRAAWFSKLGYYRDPSALPINLSSAVWNGGNIGRITVYLMRVYPVIYREKMQDSVSWRNRNAEYKRIQEYENECFKKYEEGDNVNIERRNVCPLLQMTVIDFSDNVSKPFKCTIWDSTDFHQEQLKENQVVKFYNLTLRSNGELSCNKKSYFEVLKCQEKKYEKYRRKCVELASYGIMSNHVAFGEFDTVGFIVRMHIEQNSQHFWLSDLKNNFLLVKIVEGPNNCLLLNKVEENQLVAVCNLMLKESNHIYVIATASFQTIVTQYPQYNFLREKMEELEKNNKDTILSILEENKKMVDIFENGNNSVQTSHSSASDGNTLNFSRVTSTDTAMSMINIDEIVGKCKSLH